MEFSPSEVFIPHRTETPLQPRTLVLHVAVCAGGGWVGGPGEGGLVLVFGAGVEKRLASERNNDGRSFGSLEPQS